VTRPTVDQLRNLADRARKGLTDAEADRLRQGIDQLAAQRPAVGDDGPSVADCAADDQRWFDVEKAGEQP
jgi:glutathione S-transferase